MIFDINNPPSLIKFNIETPEYGAHLSEDRKTYSITDGLNGLLTGKSMSVAEAKYNIIDGLWENVEWLYGLAPHFKPIEFTLDLVSRGLADVNDNVVYALHPKGNDAEYRCGCGDVVGITLELANDNIKNKFWIPVT